MERIRFYRSEDGAIAGVCKGLGEAFDVDAGVLRIAFIILTLFGGCGIITYFTLVFSLPRKDQLSNAMEPKVLGVCAVLARRFEIEVGIMRFVAVFSLVLSFGMTFLGYVLLYFLLPEANAGTSNLKDVN